jgi:hypothetical protein
MAEARSWQDNATEFGALVRQGKDVRLALLVACSVKKGNGQGTSQLRADRHEVGKVSASEFARQAKTGVNRVLRHLTVWDRMAAKGAVPPAVEMTPQDAVEYGEVIEAVQDEFAAEFTALTDEKPTGGRPRDSKPEDAVKIISSQGAAAVIDAMSLTQRAELVEAVFSDPGIQQTTAKILASTDTGMDAVLTAWSQRPEQKDRRRSVKERQAERQEEQDEEGEEVYLFRTGTFFGQLIGLEALIREVTTEGDGRSFDRDPEAIQAANLLAAALRSMADRIEAWANNDIKDPWDRDLARMLGEEGLK